MTDAELSQWTGSRSQSVRTEVRHESGEVAPTRLSIAQARGCDGIVLGARGLADDLSRHGPKDNTVKQRGTNRKKLTGRVTQRLATTGSNDELP
jgi:c-di-AMP phosphodiesterase-like protein